ncbi:hypothetical protein QCA50_005675 [Cerrena zonata]|uniref:NmrA-like domain-containing protein n=1 Tax=Cerrena zonata TaxID=2478898 RepID=A0AAW0GDS7_9APHY
MSANKLVLVIGATGAQGMAVVDALLAPSDDVLQSPYAVRALTRDPESRRAKELSARGVEVVKGAFNNFPSVIAAMQGTYGVFVNTDGFTVGEEREIYAGIRIYELAKQVPTIRHYVWSNLDYIAKIVDYNPEYRCEHQDGKGRVGEFLKLQLSDPTESGFVWSQLTTTPYMDMLQSIMFGPLNKRDDGTVVFATPVGQGHVPMIALSDLGFFARYIFDHRTETSGQDLRVTSDIVGWDYLIETYQKVTGDKAVVVHQTIDEWFNNFENADVPLANDIWRQGTATTETTTWRKNFTAWWKMWRDDILHFDIDWIRKLNPDGHTLETWMRDKDYIGMAEHHLLKNVEDGHMIRPRKEIVSGL